jgi:pyruvate/2-oxoacid:ferredoxin oxidoreductase alpha subunit
MLDVEDPHTFYGGTVPRYYAEMRYKIQEAMEGAQSIAREASEEFGKTFGRHYRPLELYRTEDAEALLITSGTMSGTTRCVVDQLREEDHKVGAVRIRMFRPFPAQEMRRALEKVKKVGVIDRNISFGQSGIFFQEMKSILYSEKERPPLFGFVAGLGGRDVTTDTIRRAFDYMSTHDTPEETILWLDIKR